MREPALIGMDPSLKNWGIARFSRTGHLEDIRVIHTLPEKADRKSTDDFRRLLHLASELTAYLVPGDTLFVEFPIGSQSARAMVSYSAVLAILAMLQVQGYPCLAVTPKEAKTAATGDPEASKEAMTYWATQRFPEAPWPTRNLKGKPTVVAGQAEHMADAIAVAYAGIHKYPLEKHHASHVHRS